MIKKYAWPHHLLMINNILLNKFNYIVKVKILIRIYYNIMEKIILLMNKINQCFNKNNNY